MSKVDPSFVFKVFMGLNHVNPEVALWPPKTDEDLKSHKRPSDMAFLWYQ